MAESRFPRAVFGSGDEPDARFTLANERTFLAWIRTGLALSLTGVALEALDADIRPDLRLIAALVLIALGAVCAVHAWVSWAGTEAAMRMRRPLPGMAAAAIVAAGTALAIGLVVVGSLVR